ncbi:MAG TPA: molybdopterin-dependent oxidoreductase [Candidatus Deferrimicrobium sp.]|nr:molybdopterin-dependent oxidoreductase [Candidatus Deferrimicrobium sp.]
MTIDASDDPTKQSVTRRQFLRTAGGLGFGALVLQTSRTFGLTAVTVNNPLEVYPGRNWEHIYRDLWTCDSSFVFLCAPNDTHNCLLRAYVKNGVVVRIGPTFGYGKATDVYGNEASARWDPRCCQKGLALTRRLYGDRRVRGPVIRRGFKEWVDKGMPRDPRTGRPPKEYFQRGTDTWASIGWDEAAEIVAKTWLDIAKTYSGKEGAERLRAQGYDGDMIEAMHESGAQALKFRGGMPLLGARVFAVARLSNSLALLDNFIRNTGPEKSLGARHWDSYSWHTDLPPGHPMVLGQQTSEFDLHAVENAGLVLVWGMNWISTKMPDGHWLTEARLKGTKTVVIACEYSSTSNKGDEVIVVRPGTTPALALGLAHVILKENLFDRQFLERYTDLPLLVRLDTRQLLHPSDLDAGYQPAKLSNYTHVMAAGEKPPPAGKQNAQYLPQALRDKWGDFTVYDTVKRQIVPLTRDMVGEHFDRTGITPALTGEFSVTLADGRQIRVQPVFDLVKKYVLDNFDPRTTSEITWAPVEAIVSLARQIAANAGQTLMALGMGPNQFFNNDLKDRAVFFLAALTRNIGQVGGNVGSYAGNYRTAMFNGYPQFVMEDPFDVELDPDKPAKVKTYGKYESAHYFNYGDRPLKSATRNFTGKTHMPTPTKSMWLSNSNSILGNAKWHYDVVNNTLPGIELIVLSDWWWTASCEYADIVFAADSWAEFKLPDMTASVTNPFLTVYPRTPLPRIFDTRGDAQIAALVCRKLAELTGDKRFGDMWRFIDEGRFEVYLQRVLNASTNTKGYRFDSLEAQAQEGIPAYMMSRTTPRTSSYEQIHGSIPFHTRSGRMEFYRDEPEFLASGENLPVHREPVDSTFYEPNVIVAAPNQMIAPEGPEACGIALDDYSTEMRQMRHVVKSWQEVARTQHPLAKDGYAFIFHTPKYRHGSHTTPVDLEFLAVWFGPFGDLHRHDKRSPYVTEGYLDINPLDAKDLGIEDGDYIWVDSDPSDRPYRQWKQGQAAYKVARLMCRARYYPGTPRGVTRMWHNMYGATPGSVKGHETRPDGLAKSPDTNYQAMFRYGSHQSGTRAWLKPTLMTDSLARKDVFGQSIGEGFLLDVHCPTGAPREAIIRITRAEPGGLNATGLWRGADLGYRPTYENAALGRFLRGEYLKARS